MYIKLHRLALMLSITLYMSASAAELRLSGIPLDKREKLVAQLSPRLDFIKQRAPSAWRADDAAFFLKRLLIPLGSRRRRRAMGASRRQRHLT